MAIDEDTRYRLHQKFDELIGDEMATALMENLPPAGWGDVARQGDLDQFDQRMSLRFEVVEHRFEAVEYKIDASEQRIRAEVHHEMGLLRQEFAVQTRSLLLTVSGLMVTICAVVFTAAKLL